ncbi:MAG: AAA family ATPase [Symploca sp. SIO2B6]|nr:AAA family ATPase [Symploca sp. SIO2B6]
MPRSKLRRRNVAILTQQGFRKLRTEQSQTTMWNHQSKRCTLEALSEYTGISTHTLSKVHARQVGVDLRTLARYFSAFDLSLDGGDYVSPKVAKIESSNVSGGSTNSLKAAPIDLPSAGNNGTNTSNLVANPASNAPVNPLPHESAERFQQTDISTSLSGHPSPVVTWGMAPDVSVFYGRMNELEMLKQWVVRDDCRLITLFGMGGMGKTYLVTKLAEQVQADFQTVLWFSLKSIGRSHAPLTFSTFLDELLSHLNPGYSLSMAGRAKTSNNQKIRLLLDSLRQRRCLVVLDHLDGIQPPNRQILSSEWHEYSELFQQLGQGRHQSCIVLTSRVEPKPLHQLAGQTLRIRSLLVQGLQVEDIQQLLAHKGTFSGSRSDWDQLVTYYSGNPLMLNIVAHTIQLFAGSITDFLYQQTNPNTLIPADIQDLLEQQLQYSVPLEHDIIHVLAKQTAPLSLMTLQSHLPSIPINHLIDALATLKGRSLLYPTTGHFSLQPLFKAYIQRWRDQAKMGHSLILGMMDLRHAN